MLLNDDAAAADMDLKYKSFVNQWEVDPNVKCVLVQSSSPRGFSAGGDIKQISTLKQLSDVIQVPPTQF